MRLILVGALCCSFASAAIAQTPAPEEKVPRPELVDPPSESTVPPRDGGAIDVDPGKPLTQELKEGEGVLRPEPGIDPGIMRPAPDPNPGTTPVIPPPGEPGGDPSVQPK